MVLATPLAQAATLDLDTREPVRVDGFLNFAGWGASLVTTALEDDTLREIGGATGVVTVWTWDAARVRGVVPGGPVLDASPRVGDARAESFRVENATLAIDPRGGPIGLLARVGREGVASLSGGVGAKLSPVEVVRGLGGEPGLPTTGVAPGDVAWVDEPGWHYVGNVLRETPEMLPEMMDARLGIEGPVNLKVEHGFVSFVDADGRRYEGQMGATSGDPGLVRRTRLLFEGVVDASFPTAKTLGLAAPELTWTVDGTTAWTGATGEAREGDETRAFKDAEVRAFGALAFVPGAFPAASEAGARYAAQGDATFTLDGEAFPGEKPLVRALATPAESATAAVALAAVLALLARWGFTLFYTRLAPEDVLAHPRRLALWEAARGTPGLRKRDLQRALGLAWGAFSFHLRVLVASGHLRVQREGAYAVVMPSDAMAGRHAPHPSTRAIIDALPQDGGFLDVGALRDRVGYSRQRLDHHLRALEERGLARISRDERGHRSVARALPQGGFEPPAGEA